jgi:FAD/FMN-containing dehydrogenase
MPASWIVRLKQDFSTTHILDSDEELLTYSYDWWPVAAKWRQQGKSPYRPEVVFRPTSTEEVSRLLRWASQTDNP